MLPNADHDKTNASRGLAGPGCGLGVFAAWFVIGSTLALIVGWLAVFPVHGFDPDELEHAHSAWCVSRGMLPYKDFFEHHTPWLHYALSPFFRWFDVDASFDNARRFLVFARGISLGLTVAAAALTALAGQAWRHRGVGLVAAFLLIAQPVVLEKGFEIRPDVLALPLFVAGLVFLLRGLRRPADARAQQFLWAGLGVGGAIMCTQKMLFTLPGLFTGLGIWFLFAGPGHLARMRVLVMLVAGLIIPGGLTWGAFALRHGGAEFFRNNFLLNASWNVVIHEQLFKVLEGSWPTLLLCLLGACVASYAFFRGRARDWGTLILASTLAGLIVGILIVPVAHRQYYFMLMPIVCLLAANGSCFLVELAGERLRPWLLAVAVVALSILPARDLREAYHDRNEQQQARLREVFLRTKPTDLVMDGWEGMGVFRPHAFYYFFIHEELLAMMPRNQVDDFVASLESGRVHPALIALDDNLIALGSRFVRFVRSRYVSSDNFLYFSKPLP